MTLALGIALTFPPTGAAVDWTISLHGAGPIRLGMKLSAVRRILGDRTAHLEGNGIESLDACAYLKGESISESLGFMFSRGRLVRIDVLGQGIHTESGAEIGDTEERIKRIYPAQIEVEPHHYDPEGHYLNYWPKKGKGQYGMVFETDGKFVTSFRVGTQDAIALVEGCI